MSVETTAKSTTTATTSAGERKWVDAWIRWPEDEDATSAKNKGNNNNVHDDDKDDDDDDDEALPLDPFAQDPRQLFSYSFENPIGDNPIEISLKGYNDDSDQTWNSTGLTLWRAAKHLCDYLVKHDDMLQNKHILELGAGLGLCGILAHQLTHDSDSEVIVTDGDTDALVQLRDNVECHKLNARIRSCQLLWGHETTVEFLERIDGTPKMFQLLLASDIVYVDTILPPLFETVQTLLDQSDGIFLFAYCSRRQVPVTIEMVLEQAAKAGFSYELIEKVDGILIYKFQWEATTTIIGGNE